MQYNANDIKTLSFGKAARTRLGMYLSGDKQEAINLGVRELVVNVQDEYEVYKPKNPFVRISLDTANRTVQCSDNMRGFPVGIRDDGVNALTAAFLLPHSGGKMDENSYASAVGCNGIGTKIVCHTAKWLEVEVHRDGKIYFQRFESDDEGAHKVTEVEVRGKSSDTGSIITYQPDAAVYGDVFVQPETLRALLTEMSYFARGLSIELIVDGKKETFLSNNGLMDGLDRTGRIGQPISYSYEQDGCKVELALQWVAKNGKVRGYANGLYMPDGGAFISGFKTSLTRTFNSLANEKFDGEAIRRVLDGYVSVKVKQGQFSNQAKTALANPEARAATSSAISKALRDYVVRNNADFERIVDILSKYEKAELAATKARDAILNQEKKEADQKKKKIAMPDKFKDCEKHGQDSMLIICEGEELP